MKFRSSIYLHPRKIDAAFGGLDVRLPLDKEAWQRSAHEWSSPTDGQSTQCLHQNLLELCSCLIIIACTSAVHQCDDAQA